jgi:putative flippase GtrA
MKSHSPVIRTIVVGVLATAVDLALLVILVQVAHLTPVQANWPSLLVGSVVQFLGNRQWAFQASAGSAWKQAVGFFASEAVSFALNGGGFYALVHWTSIYYPLARPIAGFVIFWGFSYPSWRFIFRRPSAAPV